MKQEVGRPTVVTPQIISMLESAFIDGCSDLEACLIAGIGKTALYEYQNKHPEFAERKEILKKTPTLTARRCVVREVATDGKLALSYLERKEKNEFGLKPDTSVNVNINADKPVTDTELAVKLAFLLARGAYAIDQKTIDHEEAK